MAEPLYRAAPARALRRADLDSFVAVYHRASGLTHLITSPAPEILAMLGHGGMTLTMLAARLAADYEIADADADSLAARVQELVAVGLVAAA